MMTEQYQLLLIFLLLPITTGWPTNLVHDVSKLPSNIENCLEVDLGQIEDLRKQLNESLLVDDILREGCISFGLLDEDWRRLRLLEKRLPENSILKSKLVISFRLLMAAIHQVYGFRSSKEVEDSQNQYLGGHFRNNSNEIPSPSGKHTRPESKEISIDKDIEVGHTIPSQIESPKKKDTLDGIDNDIAESGNDVVLLPYPDNFTTVMVTKSNEEWFKTISTTTLSSDSESSNEAEREGETFITYPSPKNKSTFNNTKFGTQTELFIESEKLTEDPRDSKTDTPTVDEEFPTYVSTKSLSVHKYDTELDNQEDISNVISTTIDTLSTYKGVSTKNESHLDFEETSTDLTSYNSSTRNNNLLPHLAHTSSTAPSISPEGWKIYSLSKEELTYPLSNNATSTTANVQLTGASNFEEKSITSVITRSSTTVDYGDTITPEDKEGYIDLSTEDTISTGIDYSSRGITQETFNNIMSSSIAQKNLNESSGVSSANIGDSVDIGSTSEFSLPIHYSTETSHKIRGESIDSVIFTTVSPTVNNNDESMIPPESKEGSIDLKGTSATHTNSRDMTAVTSLSAEEDSEDTMNKITTIKYIDIKDPSVSNVYSQKTTESSKEITKENYEPTEPEEFTNSDKWFLDGSDNPLLTTHSLTTFTTGSVASEDNIVIDRNEVTRHYETTRAFEVSTTDNYPSMPFSNKDFIEDFTTSSFTSTDDTSIQKVTDSKDVFPETKEEYIDLNPESVTGTTGRYESVHSPPYMSPVTTTATPSPFITSFDILVEPKIKDISISNENYTVTEYPATSQKSFQNIYTYTSQIPNGSETTAVHKDDNKSHISNDSVSSKVTQAVKTDYVFNDLQTEYTTKNNKNTANAKFVTLRPTVKPIPPYFDNSFYNSEYDYNVFNEPNTLPDMDNSTEQKGKEDTFIEPFEEPVVIPTVSTVRPGETFKMFTVNFPKGRPNKKEKPVKNLNVLTVFPISPHSFKVYPTHKKHCRSRNDCVRVDHAEYFDSKYPLRSGLRSEYGENSETNIISESTELPLFDTDNYHWLYKMLSLKKKKTNTLNA